MSVNNVTADGDSSFCFADVNEEDRSINYWSADRALQLDTKIIKSYFFAVSDKRTWLSGIIHGHQHKHLFSQKEKNIHTLPTGMKFNKFRDDSYIITLKIEERMFFFATFE